MRAPIPFLEELEPRLGRVTAICQQIQRSALEADVHNAADQINLIEALAEALVCRLEVIERDAHLAHRALAQAALHFKPVADVLGGLYAPNAEGASHERD